MPDPTPPSEAPAAASGESYGRALVALIGGQIAMHSCMAGVRMAAPLAVLREGHAAWAVGILLGLFAAAPIVLALSAGRLADRHGYHLPIRLAVGLTVAGGICAVVSTFLGGRRLPRALPVGDRSAGAGANFGLIAIQRSAGRMAGEATELKRIFSWLGLAPALVERRRSGAGRRADRPERIPPRLRRARAPAAAEPGLGPPGAARGAGRAAAPQAKRSNAWNLLQAPGFTRLLLVNWLLSSSWDVHSFLVPILGHERGFSASAIGLVLGVFATSVAAVRLVIPFLAHRLARGQGAGRGDAHRRRRLRRLSVRPRGLGDGRLRHRPRLRPGRGAADDHDDAAPDHAGRTGTARRSPCARWRSISPAR